MSHREGIKIEDRYGRSGLATTVVQNLLFTTARSGFYTARAPDKIGCLHLIHDVSLNDYINLCVLGDDSSKICLVNFNSLTVQVPTFPLFLTFSTTALFLYFSLT
ncbi:hypothetical protein Fmac_018266 [Flemingia macrophylla]|uniref:Uncharacterized protein n=1 Tax=Flemingia macrophylla TaxID=520843 RepID=A0ABD1M4I2_9FABA